MKRFAVKRLPLVLMFVLAVLWLLLNETLALGDIVVGAILAILLTLSSMRLRPLQPRLRRVYLAAGLILVVLRDIVRSNIGVGRIVLGLARGREVKSGLLDIPLDLRDPHGLAVLAAILTSTPGTVWVDLAADHSRLTVHLLDLKDEAEWIHLIKHRYERPLMGIFQ
jgi:multicomponent K+:H+ antiporter subunit E